MANQEHIDILKQGVKVWNTWRKEHPDIHPDLSHPDFRITNLFRTDLRHFNLEEVSLRGADLIGADLRRASLTEADLRFANLGGAKLDGANLNRVNLSGADCHRTSFRGANLSGSDLSGAIFTDGNLNGATLIEANLYRLILIRTNLKNANLTGCKIYGISVWDVKLEGAKQEGLVITSSNEPIITVDNLKVAQFIYLLLNNVEIRDVIDTITSKVVLILGRFTTKRKAVLDALREELRKYDKLPVLFDFEKPTNRDFTETVRTLAHLAQFIIADLTDFASIPQELQAIIPDLEVPVQPILEEGKKQYSMFPDLRKYSWVFPLYHYKDQASLIAALQKEVIEPAEKRAKELTVEKAKRLERL